MKNKLKSEIDVLNAISEGYGDSQIDKKARDLFTSRIKKIKRSSQISRTIAVIVWSYGVFVLVRIAFSQNFEIQLKISTIGLLLFIISNLLIINKVVNGKMMVSKRVILVLRRFRENDKAITTICNHLSDASRALGVPLTIQDESFTGTPGLWYEALDRSLLVILSFALAFGVMIIILPWNILPRNTAAITILVFLIWHSIYFLLGRLVRYLTMPKMKTEHNFKPYLEKRINKIKKGRGFYNGTIIMRFDNKIWREAIEYAIKNADAIIIDFPEPSDALQWELQKCFELRQPESIVLTWPNKDNYSNEHGILVGGMNYKEARNRIPKEIYFALSEVVKPELIRRCQRIPYEYKHKGRWGAVIFRFYISFELCRSLVSSNQKQDEFCRIN